MVYLLCESGSWNGPQSTFVYHHNVITGIKMTFIRWQTTMEKRLPNAEISNTYVSILLGQMAQIRQNLTDLDRRMPQMSSYQYQQHG